MAVIEWTRNGVVIDGSQTIISPAMESSLYNIRGTVVRTFITTGQDRAEEGEYACTSYLTSSSPNQYVLDSDTSVENVTTIIYPEGNNL